MIGESDRHVLGHLYGAVAHNRSAHDLDFADTQHIARRASRTSAHTLRALRRLCEAGLAVEIDCPPPICWRITAAGCVMAGHPVAAHIAVLRIVRDFGGVIDFGGRGANARQRQRARECVMAGLLAGSERNARLTPKGLEASKGGYGG